jgi:hypothetical protein
MEGPKHLAQGWQICAQKLQQCRSEFWAKCRGPGFVRPHAECFPHTTRSASGAAFSQQARESEYERDPSRGLWRDARTIMNVLYRRPEGMTFEELSAYLNFGKERIAQASEGKGALRLHSLSFALRGTELGLD